MDTKSIKSLFIVLGLSVGTHDRINRISIEHFSTVPVVIQHSQLLGLHEVFWVLEWQSHLIKIELGTLFSLSMICLWSNPGQLRFSMLSFHWKLLSESHLQSLSLALRLLALKASMEWVMCLKWYLGKTQQADCQVTCRWPSTRKSIWKLMGHWYLKSQNTFN